MSTPMREIERRLVELFTGGSWVGGIYDMRAIPFGDGYFSTWRLRSPSPEPA